jgi:hypothetical protein
MNQYEEYKTCTKPMEDDESTTDSKWEGTRTRNTEKQRCKQSELLASHYLSFSVSVFLFWLVGRNNGGWKVRRVGRKSDEAVNVIDRDAT